MSNLETIERAEKAERALEDVRRERDELAKKCQTCATLAARLVAVERQRDEMESRAEKWHARLCAALADNAGKDYVHRDMLLRVAKRVWSESNSPRTWLDESDLAGWVGYELRHWQAGKPMHPQAVAFWKEKEVKP